MFLPVVLLALGGGQGRVSSQVAQLALQRWRQEWVGKKVWVLGAAAYSKRNAVEAWNPRLPATVVDVRLNDSPHFGSSPPAWPDQWAYEATPGLRYKLLLKLPKMRYHRVPLIVGESGPDYHPSFYGKSTFAWTYVSQGRAYEEQVAIKEPDRTGWLQFDGDAQLRRLITPMDPKVFLWGESRRVRRAFARHKVVKGMTRALVARIIGFPSMSQPLGDVWRARAWEYAGKGPLRIVYRFDERGRLSSVQGGSALQ